LTRAGSLSLAEKVAAKLSKCHCEERFSRRGNLKVIDFFKTEIASLRSQRRQKDFISDLLESKYRGKNDELEADNGPGAPFHLKETPGSRSGLNNLIF
jgi:hypothetical protein